jgi:hypothetical protein
MAVFDDGWMHSPDVNVDPSSISMNIQIKTHRSNAIFALKANNTERIERLRFELRVYRIV